MERTSFIFLARGLEEIETVTTVDVLRRAGMNVKMVSITESLQVEGVHGITLTADCLFSDTNFDDSDWLILPGGMPGAANLHEFQPLCDLLIRHNQNEGKIAAICAAPAVILAPLGIIDGKRAVCYPGFEDNMTNVQLASEPIVSDGNIVTACGPSAAMQFALALVSINKGEDTAYDVAAGMLLYPQNHQYYF